MLLLSLCFSLLLSFLQCHVRAQSFTPASIPIAIRSPYVNTWLVNTNTSPPVSNAWMTFWSQSVRPVSGWPYCAYRLRHTLTQRIQGPDVGWRGKIRIDGKMYSWSGHDLDSPSANITSLEITPTRTIYNMQVGPMNLVVTFLSPIEASGIYLSCSGSR